MFGSLGKKNSTSESKKASSETLKDTLPKIKLDLNEIDKNVMSDVQKEYLEDELKDLKEIHENDVDISPVYFNYDNEVLEVKVFIRNATKRKINFDKVPLSVSDKLDNVVANKVFDLKDLGDLKPNTARPYKLFFEDEFILNKDFDYENLKIVFGGKIQCFSGVETKIENLPENTSFEERARYDAILKGLSRLEKNTVSMSAIELANFENGDIGLTVVLRNGYEKDLDINNIPITLYDGNNVVVASGVFKSTTFKVKKLSASLYGLIFKADEVTKVEHDLTTWHVDFKCQS